MKKHTLSLKISSGLGLLAFVLVANVSRADDGSSGCGLGWQVVKKNSLLSTTTRNTTHYFLPNTFSMTSGTSGCAKHEIVKNDSEAVYFAVNNQDSLRVDMARGEGEYLNSFALALGCSESDFTRFGTMTRTQYDVITPAAGTDGVSMYQAVRSQVQADPVLSQNCIPTT